MIKYLLFVSFVFYGCGSDVEYVPTEPAPEPVGNPGGNQGGGQQFQFTDLFNGANGPGDQACGRCHGGDAFLKSQQGFCSKGWPMVANDRMPPNNPLPDNLKLAMQSICR